MEGLGAILGMGVPARLFYMVMRISPPRIRSRMWKSLYQRMARSQKDPEFRFMNYGYKDDSPPDLSEEDESDRLFIQLYQMNIRDVEIEGKEVLEVGSGRGGGASWISRTMNPKRLVAVDYSEKAVSRCIEWYSPQKNLTFMEGNAENLPFQEESFDVVYNVESSHCYGDIPAFLEGVFRVLRKGGKFCWTDMRDQKSMEKMHDQFLNSGFLVDSSKEVTKNVTDALREIDQGRREMIRKSAPLSLRKSFETFGGVPGTPIYQALETGRIRYFRYLLSKPNN